MGSIASHNHFNRTEVERWFLKGAGTNHYMCAVCCEKRASDLHHILGRGKKGDKRFSSILNCSFLCNDCNVGKHAELMKEEWQGLLLLETHLILKFAGYKANENDEAFREMITEDKRFQGAKENEGRRDVGVRE